MSETAGTKKNEIIVIIIWKRNKIQTLIHYKVSTKKGSSMVFIIQKTYSNRADFLTPHLGHMK